jgi:hypothetical protein
MIKSTINVKGVLGVIVSTEGRLTEEWLRHLNEAVNAEHNPVKYLGIDPGKSNGICGYDDKFYPQFMLTVLADDMVMFMHQFKKVETCVIENYILYPNKSKEQRYSDMQTSRVIGRVEHWAEVRKVNLVKQPAAVKASGYAFIGKKPLPKSDKRNHELDAHVHLMYWAVSKGKIDAKTLLRVPNGD